MSDWKEFFVKYERMRCEDEEERYQAFKSRLEAERLPTPQDIYDIIMKSKVQEEK